MKIIDFFRKSVLIIGFIAPVALANNQPIIKVAILDNLMSQKLASEQYLRDYMDGIKIAKIASHQLGFNLKYKTFFYDRNPLSILNKIKKITQYKPDFIIGPRSSNQFIVLNGWFSNILVLSPLASSSEAMPKNFYSLASPDSLSSKMITQFIHDRYPNNGIYLISEVDCRSCLETSNQVLEQFKNQNPGSSPIQKKIISDQVEEISIPELMSGYKKNDIIIIPGTSYASGILISRIINYLKNANPIFIGTDGWGEWSVGYVGKLRSHFPYRAYRITPQFINKQSVRYQRFEQYYKEAFHRNLPKDTISYIAYSSVMSVIAALPSAQLSEEAITPQYILSNYYKALEQNNHWFRPESYEVYLIDLQGERKLTNITT